MPARSSSGVMNEGIQPSPSRAVRRMAASLLPPIQMGGGVCQGLGKTEIRSSLKKWPCQVTSSCVHKSRSTWMASSVRRPRSTNGTPEASNSRGSSTPTPTAGKRRPCDSQSIVAISLAATTGVRYGRTTTLGPNLSRVVRAAMAASVVITSGTGTGEERRSDSQIESTSLRSS
jgi:hypothetical protein